MKRFVVLVLAFLSLEAPAAAQVASVTVPLLTSARRQGTTPSGSIVLPLTGEQFVIEVPIANADYEDERNELTFALLYWDQTTLSWRTNGRSTWYGGHYVDRRGEVNPPPREFLDPAQWGGREIRVEIDHLNSMRVGVQVVLR